MSSENRQIILFLGKKIIQPKELSWRLFCIYQILFFFDSWKYSRSFLYLNEEKKLTCTNKSLNKPDRPGLDMDITEGV